MKSYRYSDRGRTPLASASADSSRDSRTVTPPHGTYGGLLFHPKWKAKRAEILRRDHDCCVICKGTGELQVHHRQYQYIEQAGAYRMPWDYPGHLLITLCKSCHNRGHAKFKVPTLIIR